MNTKYSFDWQVFERHFLAIKRLPVITGMTGGIIPHSLIMVYISNIGSDITSDNSNSVINYDYYIIGTGSGQGMISVSIPQTNKNYTRAVRQELVSWFNSNFPSLNLTDDQLVLSSSGGFAPAAFSFANPTRSLNSAFQISTTRDAAVTYIGNTTNTLSLTGGTQGTDYLEYADDSGFTTNVVEIGHAVSSNTGSLTIGLNTSQISAWTLSGIVPAGKYVKIRSQNNTGAPTHALVKSQEVLL